jgi:NADH dehydrogenase FAD-containing subunit
MKSKSRVVIIGGGFAGARVAQDLVKSGFSNVTLVDRKDYFEVTYAMLRSLPELDLGRQARRAYRDVLRCDFRLGEVTELKDSEAVFADGTNIQFDIAVVATGSSYPTFSIAKSAHAWTLREREEEFERERERLKAATSVLIVGGGPVGVELAGEIADHFPEMKVTLAEGGSRLLPEFKEKAGTIAEKKLGDLGVNVVCGKILSPEDGEYRSADIVYTCVGPKANTGFMRAHFSDKLDLVGRIIVDNTMRVIGAQNIFALGDCSSLAGAKLGFLADMQGALLAKNITANERGRPMKPYKPLPMMALVPIGRDQGVAQMPLIGVTTMSLLVGMKQKDMFIAKQFGNLGHKT